MLRISFLFITFIFITRLAFSRQTDLRTAMEAGWVKVTAEGKGGHTDRCILLRLKNLKKKNLEIIVPAGLIFSSVDTTEQDLIVVQERILVLNKLEQRSYSLRAMCIQAGNRSPGLKSAFEVGAEPSSELERLVNFINEEKQFTLAAQYAIWAVTDNKRLENISDDPLAMFTAKLLGKNPPKYQVIHDRMSRPGQRAFVNSPAIIKGVFKYRLQEEQLVSLGLYNEAGELKYAAFEQQLQKRGQHKFSFQFKIKNIPPGKYYARLTNESKTLESLAVEF